jgi:hypothetical protein
VPSVVKRYAASTRNEVDSGMRWITVGAADQPGPSIGAFRDPAGNLNRIQELR